MQQRFQVGDRVRVAAGSWAPFVSPGQAGTVEWVSYRTPPGGEVLFYYVRLEGPGRGMGVFYPNGVEAAEHL